MFSIFFFSYSFLKTLIFNTKNNWECFKRLIVVYNKTENLDWVLIKELVFYFIFQLPIKGK